MGVKGPRVGVSWDDGGPRAAASMDTSLADRMIMATALAHLGYQSFERPSSRPHPADRTSGRRWTTPTVDTL